ncbi:MAG: glucosaminidase domain-containing protein [Bacteroidales bacterium]|nr:glucosaminidase domain-containing protein [Deltaproteobacteria bacterium]MBN2667405.1 glucosaminidase domain-containing protein [Bacteroidales bacterium]
MGRIANILLLFVLAFAGMTSCRVSKPMITPVAGNALAEVYINQYRDLAVSEMRRTGVPASITLAQGMVESDYGRSTLARTGNNHFGIKCHNGWTGPRMTKHDDRRNECFRKYRSAQESYYDHSDFLKSGSRYRSLFELDPLDYKAWARGLKKAGYATNPDYDNMLIRKIEEYRLFDLDRGITASVPPKQKKPQEIVQGKTTAEAITPPAQTASTEPVTTAQDAITFGDIMARVPRIMENNRVRYIVVKEGDTREKIEKEFQLISWELPRFNDLDDSFTPRPGQTLYIEPKKDKASEGMDFHTVVAGETMHAISQKYAVKLKSLLEMNRMGKGMEPVAGDKIWLRETITAE